ncbi:MAG: hypothetical protein AAF386_05610, partial [Pseudomonadota bacterium]
FVPCSVSSASSSCIAGVSPKAATWWPPVAPMAARYASKKAVVSSVGALRDPDTYDRYDQVILTHTCRDVAELKYGQDLINTVRTDDMFGELIGPDNLAKLTYYPTTTREQSPKMGRITTLMEDGTVFADLGISDFGPQLDRAMVCGSMGLNTDIKAIMEQRGFKEGANSDPADFVIEKAFVG